MPHGHLDLYSAFFAGTLNSTTLVATVFAPTNAAFTQLEKNLGYTPGQLLASPILKPTLEYHVVPGVAAMVRCHAMHLLPACLCHAESAWHVHSMRSTKHTSCSHASMPDTTPGL